MRQAVASNRAADSSTLRKLLNDRVPQVRLEAATISRIRQDLHSVLTQHEDRSVRALFVRVLDGEPFAIAYADQQILAGDSFREVRSTLAGHTPNTDIFDRQTFQDEDASVRGWCASNPRIFLEQM